MTERLDELRERILALDEALVELVGERKALVLEIGRIKADLGSPVLDPAREAAVVRTGGGPGSGEGGG